MSQVIEHGEWPSNRTGEAYELWPYRDRKVYVRLSSIVSIEVYSEKTWEYLPYQKRSLIDCLFGLNKVPKQYKGKTVYYVGFNLFESPAIETGIVERMRLRLIDGVKIEVDLEKNLLNDFMHRKEGSSK